MEDTDTHTRTVTWEDPGQAMQQAIGMTGLEMIQAGMRGELSAPPIAELLGFRGIAAEEGRAVVAVTPAEHHGNNSGAAHGGLAAALLDTAMWLAVYTTMPAGALCHTIQMNINYVRPLPIDGNEVRAEGRVVHRGRHSATAEGTIVDARGAICAHATTTCLLILPPILESSTGSRG